MHFYRDYSSTNTLESLKSSWWFSDDFLLPKHRNVSRTIDAELTRVGNETTDIAKTWIKRWNNPTQARVSAWFQGLETQVEKSIKELISTFLEIGSGLSKHNQNRRRCSPNLTMRTRYTWSAFCSRFPERKFFETDKWNHRWTRSSSKTYFQTLFLPVRSWNMWKWQMEEKPLGNYRYFSNWFQPFQSNFPLLSKIQLQSEKSRVKYQK